MKGECQIYSAPNGFKRQMRAPKNPQLKKKLQLCYSNLGAGGKLVDFHRQMGPDNFWTLNKSRRSKIINK